MMERKKKMLLLDMTAYIAYRVISRIVPTTLTHTTPPPPPVPKDEKEENGILSILQLLCQPPQKAKCINYGEQLFLNLSNQFIC